MNDVKTNVIIEMKSVQIVENVDRSVTELTTKGILVKEGDIFKLSYEDSEATGFEGSVTDITVNGNEMATIIRKGKSNSNLIIEHGKKHYCKYGTPFGEFTVGINTKTIKNEMTEDGGSMYMEYTVDLNSSYLSDNEIFLNVRTLS